MSYLSDDAIWDDCVKFVNHDQEPDVKRGLLHAWGSAAASVRRAVIMAAIRRADYGAVAKALGSARLALRTHEILDSRLASLFLRGCELGARPIQRAHAKEYVEDQHPRDDHGRWTDDGGPAGDDSTDTSASDAARLNLEHNAAVAHVGKLLDTAVESADYSGTTSDDGDNEEEDPTDPVWDDFTTEAKDAAREAFDSDAMDNGTYSDEAYTQARDEEIDNLAKNNDDVVAEATKELVGKMNLSPVMTEQADLFGETLHLSLDPASVSVEDDADKSDPPTLNVDELRTVGGHELTAEQKTLAQHEWETAYKQAFTDTIDNSDAVSERQNEIEMEAMSSAWNDLSDADKQGWIPNPLNGAYEIDSSNHPGSAYGENGPVHPGAPAKWDVQTEGTENYQRTSAIAQKLVELRTLEVLKERDLSVGNTQHEEDYAAAAMRDRVWEGWLGDSHSRYAVAMQLAVAKEFGGLHRLTDDQLVMGQSAAKEFAGGFDAQAASERGLARLQAYARAQWETSQFILDKAGVKEMDVYRGLMLDAKQHGDRIEPIAGSSAPVSPYDEYAKYPDMKLQRGALQSTTLDRGVANGWNGVSSREGNDKVTLRLHVPATSVFSLPVFGKNTSHEKEVVIAGLKDTWKWDAWKGPAPAAASWPIKMAKSRVKPIDLGQIEVTAPYWLGTKKKYSDAQPRNPAGTSTGGQWASSHDINDLFSRIAKPDGGFTYQPVTGQEPHEGFAVSVYDTGKSRERQFDPGTLTPEDIANQLAYFDLKGGESIRTADNKGYNEGDDNGEETFPAPDWASHEWANRRRRAASLRSADGSQGDAGRAREGRGHVAEVKAPLRAELNLRGMNPKALEWAKLRAGALVRSAPDEQAWVKEVIEDALADGFTVDETADLLRDSIGLDNIRAGAYSKFLNSLRNEGLSTAEIDAKGGKYLSRLLDARAETIARTELLSAVNAGQHALWNEARTQGVIGNNMKRVWIAAEDCCDLCDDIANDDPVDMDEPFVGDVMFPPLHPRCRCAVGLVNADD